jgi:copper chaperone CopZ
MEQTTIEVPTMYGDHHVVEVRRLLLEIPGVEDVYASSGFHVVEVTYDPEKVGPEALTHKLEQAGYTGELPMPVEVSAVPVTGNGKRPFFRHTAVYETTKSTVSFAQQVNYQGRPLWPCPGMGPISAKKLEEE